MSLEREGVRSCPMIWSIIPKPKEVLNRIYISEKQPKTSSQKQMPSPTIGGRN